MLTAAQATKDELIQHFGPRIGDSDVSAVLDECLHFCRLFNLSAEQLFAKWESFVIKMSSSGESFDIPSLMHLESLKAQMMKDQEKNVSKHLGLHNQQSDFTSPSSMVTAASSTSSFLSRKSVDHRKEAKVFTKDSIGGFIDDVFGDTTSPTPIKPKIQARQSKGKQPNASNSATAFRSPTNMPAAGKVTAGRPSTTSSSSMFSPKNAKGALSKSMQSPISPTMASQKFADRSNKGAVVEVLNENVPFASASLHKHTNVDISFLENQVLKGYRYMYSKIAEKSDIVDERLEILTNEFKEYYKWEEVSHPAQPAQATIFTVGQICTDAVTDTSSKLNDQSVMLEACRSVGHGIRVRLDLSKLTQQTNRDGKSLVADGYTLFPGKIIGVQGRNVSGDRLIVEKIFECPPPVVPRNSIQEVLAMYASSSRLNLDEFVLGKREPLSLKPDIPPLQMVVAAGPFTLEDNLLFEPLEALISEILVTKPDIVMLLGPFIDISHPLIVGGMVDETIEEMFVSQISQRLARIPTSQTKVLLVPHVKDAVCEWVSFPQPPLNITLARAPKDPNNPASTSAGSLQSALRTDLYLPENVLCLPNPVQFTLNETVVFVSNTDALFHLGSEELYRPSTITQLANDPSASPSKPTRPDRLTRLSSHILEQKSLYPLFPAPVTDDIALNYKLSEVWEFSNNIQPDILVLPSQLKYFAKPVSVPLTSEDGAAPGAASNTLVINPGSLCKRMAGGTYVKASLHPLQFPEPMWEAYWKQIRQERRAESLRRDGVKLNDSMEIDSEGVDGGDELTEEEKDTLVQQVDAQVFQRCRVEIVRI